jgi:hypothetical protein
MTFNAGFFEPSPDQPDPRNSTATGSGPGWIGLDGDFHPDRAVTSIRGGPRPGTPMPPAAGRHVVGCAPGEAPPPGPARVVVPAVVKTTTSNGVTAAEDNWPNSAPDLDFGPEGYSDPAGTTSGSATPLAPGRFARRPGATRHPSNGQFVARENIAAGRATLDQQPATADYRIPVAAGGTLAAGLCDPVSGVPSMIRADLSRAMVPVVVSANLRIPAATHPTVDLVGPSDSLRVGRHYPQHGKPTPDPRSAATPMPLVDRGPRQSLPADAVVSGSPVMLEPSASYSTGEHGEPLSSPLMSAIRAHSSSPPAFGLPPAAYTSPAPGWD